MAISPGSRGPTGRPAPQIIRGDPPDRILAPKTGIPALLPWIQTRPPRVGPGRGKGVVMGIGQINSGKFTRIQPSGEVAHLVATIGIQIAEV